MTITFGEIMLRLCPEGRNLLLQSLPGRLDATFGGAEANVAMSLARLGMPSRYVTALPDNQIAEACLNQLRGFGVDVSCVKLVKGSRMGVYFLESGANQRPSKVVYDRADSAISGAKFEDYDFATALKGATRLHISGITPAISEAAADACVKLSDLARKNGVKISFDLNFRNKLWKWREGVDARTLAREVVPQILENADLVIGNEEDAFDVLGIKSGGSDVNSGKLDFAAYADTAREIARRFKSVRKVAFTLRESLSAFHNNWGATLYDVASDKSVMAPMKDGQYKPYEIKNIVDRVGGGDSFAAGLIYGLDSGEFKDDSEALEFAVASSCLAHSMVGDYNYTTKSEVLTLMKGNGSGRVQR